jgi:hypothetical protein
MESVIELPTCRRCGAVTGKKIDIVHAPSDLIVLTGRLCDGCLRAAVREVAELRKDFEQLLADGIDREQANLIMIERIEKRQQLEVQWRPYDKEN